MVNVFNETDIENVAVSKNSQRIATIKKELVEKHLKKVGSCCLFNEAVRQYSKEGKSDPGLHSQLKNALKKDSLLRVIRKENRLLITRVA